MCLQSELILKYNHLKSAIKQKLIDFENVDVDKYFYELCFCICTPQSKAQSALLVQNELELLRFRENDFDPADILRRNENYIRFHNQKAARLIEMKSTFNNIEKVILSELSPREKREYLVNNVKGIGMKESSHFLRNIGFRNLAILDRHILRNLVRYGVFDKIPNISTYKLYEDAEVKFMKFASDIEIPIDELDLLFWSQQTGIILK